MEPTGHTVPTARPVAIDESSIVAICARICQVSSAVDPLLPVPPEGAVWPGAARVVTPAEKWERAAAAGKPARNAVAANARGDQGGLGLPWSRLMS